MTACVLQAFTQSVLVSPDSCVKQCAILDTMEACKPTGMHVWKQSYWQATSNKKS